MRAWLGAVVGGAAVLFYKTDHVPCLQLETSGRHASPPAGIEHAIGREQRNTAAFLLLLTAAAFLTQGYHPFVEDAEIYLPGVERLLDPSVFPSGQEFFQSHARMTLFPNLVAYSLRATHLKLEAGLMTWQLASILLLLAACWRLSGVLFSAESARWSAVCMVASVLTLPVAGTALIVMDQYLNPRNLAGFAAVFAVAHALQKKYVGMAAWVLFAAVVHPLMWVFPFSFCWLSIVLEKWEGHAGVRLTNAAVAGALLWAGIPLAPQSSAAYHEAAKRHAYFFIQHWAWYEWLGVLAPPVMLLGFARIARRQQRPMLARACRAFAIYGAIYFVIALAVDLPARFEALARLQPLRSLHLMYLFLLLIVGGFLGEYALKRRAWRWLALFVPLSLGMFAAQRAEFPGSAHVEWPGRTPKNPWAQSFVWARENTPVDAIFALDPEYMRIAGEDEIGFRCLAQRSRLADATKDNGVVSMFPQLAEEWWGQLRALDGWRNFKGADFARLRDRYGVSWVIVQQPGGAGLECAYENAAVRVCRVR